MQKNRHRAEICESLIGTQSACCLRVCSICSMCVCVRSGLLGSTSSARRGAATAEDAAAAEEDDDAAAAAEDAEAAVCVCVCAGGCGSCLLHAADMVTAAACAIAACRMGIGDGHAASACVCICVCVAVQGDPTGPTVRARSTRRSRSRRADAAPLCTALLCSTAQPHQCSIPKRIHSATLTRTTIHSVRTDHCELQRSCTEPHRQPSSLWLCAVALESNPSLLLRCCTIVLPVRFAWPFDWATAGDK